jgi:hypothetical protein
VKTVTVSLRPVTSETLLSVATRSLRPDRVMFLRHPVVWRELSVHGRSSGTRAVALVLDDLYWCDVLG